MVELYNTSLIIKNDCWQKCIFCFRYKAKPYFHLVNKMPPRQAKQKIITYF